MKTIVVDDEPIMLRRFARITGDMEKIELVGCFRDGESALDFLSKNQVELACIDITMPIMSGTELADIIREKYPDIRIVFISALENTGEDESSAYILKPYTRELLEKTFEKL